MDSNQVPEDIMTGLRRSSIEAIVTPAAAATKPQGGSRRALDTTRDCGSERDHAGHRQPQPSPTNGSPLHHLNQIELSRRWRISPRTLERWRWRDQGPRYIKIGGRVVYRLEDVTAFEAAQIRGRQ